MILGRRQNMMFMWAALLGAGCGAHGSGGLAHTSGGVATDSRATWASDCGVTEPIPDKIPVLDAQRSSPHSIMIKSADVGILKSDECTGAAAGGAKVQVVRQSVQVVRLIPPKETTPQATGDTPKVYGIEEIPPSEWHKYRR
jgi:hypothetical protein